MSRSRTAPAVHRGPARTWAALALELAAANECRVLVLGSPGSGKTIFSRFLAALTGLRLYHLDDLHWGNRWTRPDAEHWLALQCIAASGPSWIIDGSYIDTLPVRMRRATMVVVLDLPTWRCLLGIFRRSLDQLLGKRELLPARIRDGEPCRWRGMPWRLVRKVLTFRTRSLGAIFEQAAAALGAGRLIVLRDRSEMAAVLKAIGALRSGRPC